MSRQKSSGQLRIIGGDWRGRKLSFPAVNDLRPTPDRVRETLFNWLQIQIHGARCLDLFAGSGALGLEALSRGAGDMVFVEKNSKAANTINDHLKLLQCEKGRVINTDALTYLKKPATPFDLVFLDPPYQLNLLAPCCELLESNDWLSPEAHIYIEASSQSEQLPIPANWEVIRSKKAGDVGYHLAKRQDRLE